jgi:hypothetical protein
MAANSKPTMPKTRWQQLVVMHKGDMKAASKEYCSGKVVTSKRYRSNANDTSLISEFETNISKMKKSQRLSVYAVIPAHKERHILSIIKNHNGHTGLWVHNVSTNQFILCQNVHCVFSVFVNNISQLHYGIEGVKYVVSNDAQNYSNDPQDYYAARERAMMRAGLS